MSSMAVMTAPAKPTPDEIARLSDQEDKLYERVDGNLVEKQLVIKRSIWVASRLSYLLQTVYPPERAYVLVEQPTYCFPKGNMRRPDVALVWAERLAEGLSDDELYIPPDLVIEVVSPTNTMDDQFQRVAEYLAAGVPIVLIAHPSLRWLHICRKDGPVSVLRGDDTLKDEPLLPGLVLKVADIFPPEPARKVEA